MLKYARMDTHFLLYIYDRMRNEILSRTDSATQQLLNVVLSRSAQTSLKLYEKEIYDAEHGQGPNGWSTHLRKLRTNVSFTAEQMAVYKALHGWRDRTAREEDESVRYVLPNAMLLRLVLDLPSDMPGVIASCGYPTPNMVRLYAADIVAVVDRARTDFKELSEIHRREMLQMQEEVMNREKERLAKQLAGPIHTRFDEEEDDDKILSNLQGDNDISFAINDKINVQSSNDHDKINEDSVNESNIFRFSGPNHKSDIKFSVKLLPGLFGSLETNAHSSSSTHIYNNDDTKAMLQSLKEAVDRIHSTLYLEPPGFHLVKKRKRELEEAALAKDQIKKSTSANTSSPSSTTTSNNNSSIVDIGKVKTKKAKLPQRESAPSKSSSSETNSYTKPIPALSGPAFSYEEESKKISQSKPVESEAKEFSPYSKVDDSKFKNKKGPKGNGGKSNVVRSMSFKK